MIEIIGTLLAWMYVLLWVMGPIALIVGTIDAAKQGKYLKVTRDGQWKMVDKQDFSPELPERKRGQNFIVRR